MKNTLISESIGQGAGRRHSYKLLVGNVNGHSLSGGNLAIPINIWVSIPFGPAVAFLEMIVQILISAGNDVCLRCFITALFAKTKTLEVGCID